MASGFITWLIVAAPVAMLIGAWGWSLIDRGRRLGWILVAWAIVGPLAPPLLTLGTWLLVGESSPRSGHEPWPYYNSVATLSTLAVILVTPFLLGFVALDAVGTLPPKNDSQTPPA